MARHQAAAPPHPAYHADESTFFVRNGDWTVLERAPVLERAVRKILAKKPVIGSLTLDADDLRVLRGALPRLTGNTSSADLGEVLATKP